MHAVALPLLLFAAGPPPAPPDDLLTPTADEILDVAGVTDSPDDEDWIEDLLDDESRLRRPDPEPLPPKPVRPSQYAAPTLPRPPWWAGLLPRVALRATVTESLRPALHQRAIEILVFATFPLPGASR